MDCFKNNLKSVKSFYIRCMIYLSIVNCLSKFEESIKDIFNIIMSPYENEEIKEKIQMFFSKFKTTPV